MADWKDRFRFEGGLPCVDMRVRRVEQLFDHRDPAPFHERDLDDDAAEYLRAVVEELPNRERFKIVVWIEEPIDLPPNAVEASIERHFAAARDTLRRKNKRARARVRWMTLIAFVMLVVFLTLAEVTREWRLTSISLIPESLTILAWVVMWRPLESLVFDWIPYLAERRMLDRIRSAPIEVRVGSGI